MDPANDIVFPNKDVYFGVHISTEHSSNDL